MSWDINHVVVVGRLTRDPELSYTQSGSAVCRFSIAVNRSSGQASEGQEESASFFNVVAWNKTAEICKEYLSKGKQVGIDGRLQQRRWSGVDGVKRSNIEIVANNVQFFGPPQRQAAERSPAPEQRFAPQDIEGQDFAEEEKRPADVKRGAAEQGEEPFISELDDDEIPF